MRPLFLISVLLLSSCGGVSQSVTDLSIRGCGEVDLTINDTLPVSISFCEVGLLVEGEMVHCAVVRHAKISGFNLGAGYIEQISDARCEKKIRKFQSGTPISLPEGAVLDGEPSGPSAGEGGDEPADEPAVEPDAVDVPADVPAEEPQPEAADSDMPSPQ